MAAPPNAGAQSLEGKLAQPQTSVAKWGSGARGGAGGSDGGGADGGGEGGGGEGGGGEGGGGEGGGGRASRPPRPPGAPHTVQGLGAACYLHDP